jgi:hypothetical protein
MPTLGQRYGAAASAETDNLRAEMPSVFMLDSIGLRRVSDCDIVAPELGFTVWLRHH